MNFLTEIYRTVIDALFPLSDVEEELLSLSPEEALAKLPPAPAYDASVVPLPDARSIFTYKDERVSKLIWSIKYKKSVHAVRIGGFALYKNIPKNQKVIIIPIPITPRRHRERGFNQCELLLDEIKRLDTDGRFSYEKNLLERVQHGSRQTLKSRDERLEGSKGIFKVNEEIARRIRNSQTTGNCKSTNPLIVIIDDVITTGSTMKEALDILLADGFSNVAGLSLAH